MPVTSDNVSPSAGDLQYLSVFPETMSELVHESDDDTAGSIKLWFHILYNEINAATIWQALVGLLQHIRKYGHCNKKNEPNASV